jgi:hypothetical protein
MLIGLACLTVAAAVARAAPRWSIELGLVLLAAVDVILVWGTDQVGTATTALAEATAPTPALPLLPDRPLPVLQQATFGSASMGWLDLLAPALLCAVVVARARRRAAITTAMAAGLWGLLLFVTPLLPATVPILAGLLVARAPSALHRMGLRTVMDSAANRVLRTGRPDRIAVRPNARP